MHINLDIIYSHFYYGAIQWAEVRGWAEYVCVWSRHPKFFWGIFIQKKIELPRYLFCIIKLLRFICPLPKELIHVTLPLPTLLEIFSFLLIWYYIIKRSDDWDWVQIPQIPISKISFKAAGCFHKSLYLQMKLDSILVSSFDLN